VHSFYLFLFYLTSHTYTYTYTLYRPLSLVVTLPEWTTKFYNERKNTIYTDDKEMMRVAMELSKVNIDNETGGPFGTAIFEYNPDTNESKLFSLGVNRVVPLCNSTLHGEMTAIQFGQQRINNFSFACAGSAQGNKQYHLYTSSAPCCQCLGGIMWSGVSKLVCGATKDDVESIGFHEGPVFDPLSYDALEDAGCTVIREVLREECAEVLQYYKENGEIYNP
jgi:tRNA(Arg) A34 adenosine deaminase TadA